MSKPDYPLKLEPIFQYRLWGGRKLETIVTAELPEGPVGEAWILSDRDDFSNAVANGPLAGKSLSELVAGFPDEMLGTIAEKSKRYPLLLKYLDAKEMLSVQVHPSDAHKELLPPGERGKTEAWVVLDAEPESKIFAGLAAETTRGSLTEDLANGKVERDLSSFVPKVGDGVFIEAGTVHALGGGVVVFEVQQNSDVTFRLYDWNRVDEKTGKPRELHIKEALECIDFAKGPQGPIEPTLESTGIEKLFDCEFFRVLRFDVDAPFAVGPASAPTVLVCLSGDASLVSAGHYHTVHHGDVWFLPVGCDAYECKPNTAASFLVITVPG